MYTKTLQIVVISLLGPLLAGCGTTKLQRATEQILVSNAVDRSVANIDFHRLAGKTVYLDTQYLKPVKSEGFVNADYIISSLRQQMVAASCLLEDDKEKADYICEVRVGALGTDSHDVTYGIPASSALSNAASLLPNAPPIPMIPEISFAKRMDELAAAKIAVFAYDRKTRMPVWQSGIKQARSTSKNTWLFGAGPFQSGTIFDRTQFAGEELDIPLMGGSAEDGPADPLTMYNREVIFVPSQEAKASSEVQQASYTKPQDKSKVAIPVAPPPAKSGAPAAEAKPITQPVPPPTKPAEPSKPKEKGSDKPPESPKPASAERP